MRWHSSFVCSRSCVPLSRSSPRVSRAVPTFSRMRSSWLFLAWSCCAGRRTGHRARGDTAAAANLTPMSADTDAICAARVAETHTAPYDGAAASGRRRQCVRVARDRGKRAPGWSEVAPRPNSPSSRTGHARLYPRTPTARCIEPPTQTRQGRQQRAPAVATQFAWRGAGGRRGSFHSHDDNTIA
jgi:hypothetical protein